MSADNPPPQPRVRTGQTPTQLSKDEFIRRWNQNFYDPAFEQRRAELDAIGEIAWEAYHDSRKSPRSRKVGPGFGDPEHELSIEWLNAREKLLKRRSSTIRKNRKCAFTDLRLAAYRPNLPERGDHDEKEANLFAAELLMPANLIADDIRRIGVLDLHDERRIEELAKSYHVSTQAMTIRLQQILNFCE